MPTAGQQQKLRSAALIICMVVLVYFVVIVFHTDRQLSWKDKAKQKPAEPGPEQ